MTAEALLLIIVDLEDICPGLLPLRLGCFCLLAFVTLTVPCVPCPPYLNLKSIRRVVNPPLHRASTTHTPAWLICENLLCCFFFRYNKYFCHMSEVNSGTS